jgi:hypothetical protein
VSSLSEGSKFEWIGTPVLARNSRMLRLRVSHADAQARDERTQLIKGTTTTTRSTTGSRNTTTTTTSSSSSSSSTGLHYSSVVD